MPSEVGAAPVDAVLRSALKGQYHAALAMLRRAIELFPDDVWAAGGRRAFWRIAYHALYFTHLYLQRDEASFVPWERHQTGIEELDESSAAQPDEQPGSWTRPQQTGVPYSRREVLEYWDVCDRMVDGAIDAVDVLAPETGFSWHTPSRSKVEQHIVSIRHIQHHTAQLAGRVHEATHVSVGWVGAVASAGGGS